MAKGRISSLDLAESARRRAYRKSRAVLRHRACTFARLSLAGHAHHHRKSNVVTRRTLDALPCYFPVISKKSGLDLKHSRRCGCGHDFCDAAVGGGDEVLLWRSRRLVMVSILWPAHDGCVHWACASFGFPFLQAAHSRLWLTWSRDSRGKGDQCLSDLR